MHARVAANPDSGSPHPRAQDGMRPLHFAAAAGSEEACCALLEFGAQPDVFDEDGLKPIQHLPVECLATQAQRQHWETLLGSAPGAWPDSVEM